MQETHRAAGRALKAVVFDMDNTLFEFVDAQLKACEAVVGRLGAGDKMGLFALFAGGPHGFECPENIADYMQHLGIHDQAVFLECCEAYERTKLDSLVVYGGIRESLEGLKRMGLRLAVVTDASAASSEARLKRTGLRRFFDVLVSAEEVGQKKPHPASIRLALERLDVEADEALFVGDSIDRDMAAGRNLGIRTAYASYGDRNPVGNDRAGVDHVLRSPVDIISIAERMCRAPLQRGNPMK